MNAVIKRNLVIIFPVIVILTFLSGKSFLSADVSFEKGDSIYREAFFPFPWLLGHAVLYWHWKNGEEVEDKDQKIIESGWGGVKKSDFEKFCAGGNFWSVRTNNNLTWQQRRTVVNTAKKQMEMECKYNFLRGYKRPGKSFRCDGLVEYCYEIALGEPWQPGSNGGIIKNDTWFTLSPYRQMKRQSLRTSAQLEKLTFHEQGIIEVGEAITPSKYLEGIYNIEEETEITIKFYASDGKKGSGLTRAELWIEKPDGTTEEIGESDTNYDVDHIYSFSYDTGSLETGEEYTLHAKAYDQAGNYKETTLPFIIVSPVSAEGKWEGYDLRLTFERDPEGPVYAIYYKETEENDWTELGEFDTQDTGGSGDIILNLGLDLDEFESEDDDADRITHQYKLVMVTAGKDVFKDAYGYKTIRLIVDTTADWEAGEKDGITVHSDCSPSGCGDPQPKAGWIEPVFGGWTAASQTDTGYHKYAFWDTSGDCSDSQLEGLYNSAKSSSPLSGSGVPYQNYYDCGPCSCRLGCDPYGRYKITFPGEKPKKLRIILSNACSLCNPEGCTLSAFISGVGLISPPRYPDMETYTAYLGVQSSGYEVTITHNNNNSFASHEYRHGGGGGYATSFYGVSFGFNIAYLDEDQGIWSRTFLSITSEKYEDYHFSDTDGKNGITGEWVVDEESGEERWKVTIEFPYEEGEPTTWFDRFRYDFKEKKAEENPA